MNCGAGSGHHGFPSMGSGQQAGAALRRDPGSMALDVDTSWRHSVTKDLCRVVLGTEKHVSVTMT